ncbi:MAG: hypothetical protein HEQ40_13555 [Lacibacter sp.]
MIRILWILFFTGCAFIGSAQERKNNIYAVVIGISNYESKNIRQLVYSHKDAQLFAQWLQSTSGGNVPGSNIRVLLNEQATIAAIYNALDWLKQQCKEGDDVYIYFSGHGDIETVDNRNKGYLLAYNTPPHNYPNNAVSVEQLNEDANYLTLQKKARVVIITDACHSGKLAGDFFKGKQWVAQQLQQVLNNEIRLASCAADEEAAEGEFWDGGRGVFSYYLLRGLYGQADIVKDKQITFDELQQYINTSFKADEYLQLLNHKQAPVTDGNPLLVMARVDSSSVQQNQPQQKLIPAAVEPIDAFFNHALTYPFENFIAFGSLPPLTENTFASYIIEQCIVQDSIDNTTTDASGKKSIYLSAYSDTLELLKKQLLTDASLRKQFNEKFVELVQTNAQAMINAYLNGEESELEKRQYYYSGSRNYNDFLPMIKLALTLIPSNHHLTQVLQINLHYLSGVLARLQMATSKKTDSLVKAAFQHQYKTLELEPYAAYVHNELANLYVHRKIFDSAQYHFDMASALASTWAIPWSNQIRMNLMLKNNKKATMALHKADSLQPNLSYVYMNAGILMERKQQLLEAISYYERAAKLNPVHFLPFERLGYLYLQTGSYENANACFIKAASLKNDFAINDNYFRYGVELGGFPPVEPSAFLGSCFDKSNLVQNNQHPFVLLLRTIASKKAISSDSFTHHLQFIIREQPAAPLAHHYLGKTLVESGKFKEAIPVLKEAMTNYVPDSLLLKRFTGVFANEAFETCLVQLLPYLNYDVREDFYLLALAYEQLHLMEDAIAVYEKAARIENEKLKNQAIFKDYEKNFELEKQKHEQAGEDDYVPMDEMLLLYEMPVKPSSVILQMKLYEQLQNYEKAEAVLLQQVALSRKAGDLRRRSFKQVPGTDKLTGIAINFFWIKANRDLEITVHDFYTRMMQLQPRNFYWKQQAASFLYHRLELAYSQLPQELYASFTADFSNHAYPWGTSDEIYKAQQAYWPLPGLKDTIVIETPAFLPVQTALNYAVQAQVLSPNTAPDVETAVLFADLNNWLGIDTASKRWYEYALRLVPKDSAIRNRLVQLLLYTGNYTEARHHLDTLQLQQHITAAGRQVLIFFHTAAGNYTRAVSLIRESVSASVSDRCHKLLQEANVLLLQKKYITVINLLEKQFPQMRLQGREDEEATELQQLLAIRFYVLARCYALLKQDAQAVNYLKKAMANGFANYHVIINDAAWATIKRGNNKKLFQEAAANAKQRTNEGDTIPVDITPLNYRIPGEANYADYLQDLYRSLKIGTARPRFSLF